MAKFREEGVTDVSQILIRSGRNMGPSYAEEIVSISSAFERILMHERDRQTVTGRQTGKQTDCPRNGNSDTNRRNRS